MSKTIREKATKIRFSHKEHKRIIKGERKNFKAKLQKAIKNQTLEEEQ